MLDSIEGCWSNKGQVVACTGKTAALVFPGLLKLHSLHSTW
jgi:hypothetical protein